MSNENMANISYETIRKNTSLDEFMDDEDNSSFAKDLSKA
jgi:hypothetical protein